MIKNISQLPTRYEPLIRTFGEKAKTTFVEQLSDIAVMKTVIARMESAQQGKIMFIFGKPGVGKTTFIHSLEVFLADRIAKVQRLPKGHELSVLGIPNYIANLPQLDGVTVVNFDEREAPYFDEAEYRTFLIQLNGILRSRPDLLILWPVNQRGFAKKLTSLLEEIGGRSAFGAKSIYDIDGLSKEQYKIVFQKILQIANWHLEDAAIGWDELERIENGAESVGRYLDDIQELISERFDTGKIGVNLPELVFVLSSGKPEIRDVCRNLRRADSYYVEASRLTMYTKKSNAADWWEERSKKLTTALPYIVALFNAQLVSVSGSTVVHSVLQFGPEDMANLASGVQKNIGNAKRVVSSSELYKYSIGQDVDSREYGLNVKEETRSAYDQLQVLSKNRHLEINKSIVSMVNAAGGGLDNAKFEVPCGIKNGLFADVQISQGDKRINFEFHHKATAETGNNKVAIYILGKLKEYAINYGLVSP